jgi:predicted O-methyltransferase YrrM
MISFAKQIRRRLFRGLAQQSDIDRLYDQIHGLLQIQNAMMGRPVLRPLRRWAMSPDAMVFVLASLQGRDAPAVVEFGSGQSTLVLAAALQHCKGTLLSIDHDVDYSADIQKQVSACGLVTRVEFLHCPLCPTGETPGERSYDLSRLPETAGVDLALVDGPPSENGTLTRLVPLRWAARHLKPGGAMFLDDTARDGEQKCLNRISIEFPHLRQISHHAEKGLVEVLA